MMKYNKFYKDCNSGRLLKVLIDKQLEPFNLTIEDVSGEENDGWYSRYKVSEEESNKWREWGVNYIRENYNMPKKVAEREMSWVFLMWGLAIKKDK